MHEGSLHRCFACVRQQSMALMLTPHRWGSGRLYLNVVGLIKDEHRVLPFGCQAAADLGVDEVIVGHEHDVGGGGHLTRQVEGAGPHAAPEPVQVLYIHHLPVLVRVRLRVGLRLCVPAGQCQGHLSQRCLA